MGGGGEYVCKKKKNSQWKEKGGDARDTKKEDMVNREEERCQDVTFSLSPSLSFHGTEEEDEREKKWHFHLFF